MTNIGKWRDHYSYFNECRNKVVNDTTAQTNSLIIRLDKLINHVPTDDSSKRDFEKSIVLWSEDAKFSNCRVCNAKFSITRRKHHCRLCGKIMCHNCSQFLSYTSARKLTGPEASRSDVKKTDELTAKNSAIIPVSGLSAFSGVGERRSLSMISMNDSLHFMRNRTGRILGSLIGSSSRESLIDVSGFSNGVDQELSDRIRICEVCKRLLQHREIAMDQRTSQFIFVDIYQRLFQLLTEIYNLAPTYRYMADSLSCGKTIFSLNSAIELRRKMVSIQREIGTLSDRIEKWGLSDEVEDPLITSKPSVREVLLQKNIRIFAVNTLHETISKLPDLPSQQNYEKLATEFREKEIKAATVVAPDNVEDTIEELDVIQQQYLNIKSYLLQAAQDGRLEEVEILEQNLLNLESELRRKNLPTPHLSV